eukprot:SAG22_NODE_2931_length_2096_cov_1.806710_3_plen_96_part_00
MTLNTGQASIPSRVSRRTRRQRKREALVLSTRQDWSTSLTVAYLSMINTETLLKLADEMIQMLVAVDFMARTRRELIDMSSLPPQVSLSTCWSRR